VAEPDLWKAKSKPASPLQIFRPPLARRTAAATALATSVLFAYWGLFTWIPGFLSASRASGHVLARQEGWQQLDANQRSRRTEAGVVQHRRGREAKGEKT
jgi:hypothetical protein